MRHLPVNGVLSILAMIVAQNKVQGRKMSIWNSTVRFLLWCNNCSFFSSETGLPWIAAHSILFRVLTFFHSNIGTIVSVTREMVLATSSAVDA